MRDIPLALYYLGGKLTPSKRQNACKKESDGQAQLTNLEPSTQELYILPLASVTDSGGYQSEKTRRSLSTDSLDSGVSNSSQSSPSTLSQQDSEYAVERRRHYSDSKMTRYRKTEIRNKLGSVLPLAHSGQIYVSTQVEILPYNYKLQKVF